MLSRVPHFVPREEYRETKKGSAFDFDPKITITLPAEQIEWVGSRDIDYFLP